MSYTWSLPQPTSNRSKSMARSPARGSLILAAAVGGFIGTKPLLAANDTWIGPAGGTWSTPGNWNPTGEPAGGGGASGDSVTFAPDPSSTYIFDGAYAPTAPLNAFQFGSLNIGAPTL